MEEHPVGVPKRPDRAEHHAVVDMSLLSASELTAQKKDTWLVKIGIEKSARKARLKKMRMSKQYCYHLSLKSLNEKNVSRAPMTASMVK